MVRSITGELVVTSARSLRWKNRIFFLVVFLLGGGGGYSWFKLGEAQAQNVLLDARIVEINNSYSKRIIHLKELIDLFEKEFFGDAAVNLAGKQREKLDEYRAKLLEHKRKVEVEQIADKIRLLTTNINSEYALVIADSIHTWAEPYGNDPDMLIALIYVESHFNNKPVSNKGAVGLTQVMPAWVKCNYPKMICSELRFINSKKDLAENDDKNIRAGSAILSFMLKKSDGNWDQALASYNLGWSKVGAQVDAGEEYDYKYAKKVLRVYTRLKQMALKKTASLKKRKTT